MREPVPAWVLAHLRPGEEPLYWCRPSMVGILPIFASTVAGIGILVAQHMWGLESPGLVQGQPALVLAVLGLAGGFVRQLARLRFTTYVVTRERFYALTTFLARDAKSVPLSRVSTVSLRRGVMGWLLGYWSARVGLYGEEKHGIDVPAVREGARLLDELAAGQRRASDAAWLLRGD